jgi:hypothetical protein
MKGGGGLGQLTLTTTDCSSETFIKKGSNDYNSFYIIFFLKVVLQSGHYSSITCSSVSERCNLILTAGEVLPYFIVLFVMYNNN